MVLPLMLGRAGRLAWALAICVGGLACAGCSGASAAPVGTCALRTSVLLAYDDMSDSVELFRTVKVPLPGQEGLPGHPPWDVTQYVCGEDESFVSDLIMYGRYRAQDDAFARSLGYITGKWPLLPYEGSAVSQRPHDIFETYEEIYQFRSPGAAAMWLGNLRGPSSRDDLAGLQLPAAFIARTEVMGPDNGRDEHSIDVSGERGDEVLFVTFRGGLLLSWHDVSRPWSSAYALISKASAG